MDGREGTVDTPIGSKLEVEADVEVDGVPSP